LQAVRFPKWFENLSDSFVFKNIDSVLEHIEGYKF